MPKFSLPFLHLLLFILLTHHSKAQGFSWAGQISGPTNGPFLNINTKASAVDMDGNNYIAGGFSGTIDFDPGPGVFNLTAVNPGFGGDDVFVAKYTPGGTLIWAKSFGSTQQDYARSIAVHPNGTLEFVGDFRGQTDFDPGPGVVNLTPAGTNNPDIFILKLDPQGNFLSVRAISPYTNSSLLVGNVISDRQGNSIVSFTSNGTVDYDPGPGVFDVTCNIADIVLAKYAPNGSVIWVKPFLGGNGVDGINRMLIDAQENIVIGGSFNNSVDFDPGPGTQSLTSDGANDGFFGKYNSSGNLIWIKQFRNANTLGITNFVTDATGDSYCMGYFSGNGDFDPGPGTFNLNAAAPLNDYDAFIVKLEENGDFGWASKFMVSGRSDGLSTILLDNDGTLHISVNFDGTIDTDPGAGTSTFTTLGLSDIAVIRIKTDRTFVSSNRIGGTEYQYMQYASIDREGMVFYNGTFGGTVDFDPGPGIFNLTSTNGTGSVDFIMKFSGANYIKGITFQDNNGNGTQQAGEPVMRNVMMKATRSGLDYYGISDTLGQYSIEVDPGNYTITPTLPLYFSSIIPASHTANFNAQTGQTDTANHFGLVRSSIINDARVTITNIGPARPGFAAIYTIICENVGTEKISGNVVLTPDPTVTFIASNPPPNPALNWSFTDLLPSETRNIDVGFLISQTAALGSFLKYHVSLTTTTTDFNLFDNVDSLRQMVTGSFDPNDKKVTPDGAITTAFINNGSYLDYTIRFQNTGTDTAFTVKIKDTLSTNLDVSSFRMIGASHHYSTDLKPNGIVEWTFNNILLPDSNVNEPRSHGFVRFRIKPKNTLVPGNQVRNRAAIYFDFNAPVITNETQNIVTVVTSVSNPGQGPVIKVYPNPARSLLILETKGSFDYSIIDESGKRVRNETGNFDSAILDINTLAKGVYFVRIETKKGFTVRKIVVQ